jgi:hypothetical protein
MSKTLESLLGELPRPTAREPRICEVDLTDLLGDGWVMQYREPSVADLFAAADTRTLAEWERVLPDIPRDLASTLELIARLHLAPPAAEMPTGKFYAELLRRLPPQTTIAVLRRIGDTISTAFGLDNIEALAEAKKKPSKRAVKR